MRKLGMKDSPPDNPLSWEGRSLQPSDETELHEAVSRAFDFRGDVTIHLRSRERVTGFVFDRHAEASHPYIRLFLPDHPQPYIISYQDIVQIVFSGADAAFGRSWEDWAQKWKKAESHN